MWQKLVKPYVESGRLVAIGVVQEQHTERARLYKQWRKLDWPIAVDSLNLLGHRAVPIPMGLDARGIIRSARLRPNRFEQDFMGLDFPDDQPSHSYNRVEKPDRLVLRKRAEGGQSYAAWRDLGDALFLYGGDEGLPGAVEAYRRAVSLEPGDGRSHFRLGVALRRRYESLRRRPLDAQGAVDSWGLALAADPGQYIWRRRIQQYGPRLDKPYNFYFWVEKARRDIRARGEEPLPLLVEPMGSEVAEPRRGGSAVEAKALRDLDPTARIPMDTKKLVAVESMVTPARVRPGHRVRVRVTFRLDEKTRPYWNNEASGLSFWAEFSKHFQLDEGAFQYDGPRQSETRELRNLEFEAAVGSEAVEGPMLVPAYALYDVCLDKEGVCYRYRQDFKITIRVDPHAPAIQ